MKKEEIHPYLQLSECSELSTALYDNTHSLYLLHPAATWKKTIYGPHKVPGSPGGPQR